MASLKESRHAPPLSTAERSNVTSAPYHTGQRSKDKGQRSKVKGKVCPIPPGTETKPRRQELRTGNGRVRSTLSEASNKGVHRMIHGISTGDGVAGASGDGSANLGQTGEQRCEATPWRCLLC
eukprot:2945080-Rhodomonas_salina.2